MAMEKELTCSICLDTYTDPKILQCFHVYCQKCLVKLVDRDQQGHYFLSCPTCRQVTPVPANGTKGLHPAFHINRFLDILNQQKNDKRVDSEVNNRCPEHDEREVELFCEPCGELVCYKCVAKSGKHHGHDYKEINESFERYKKEVTRALEPLERKMTALSKELTQLDKHCDTITYQRAAIEAEIQESSKQLHDIINNRRDQLIVQLNEITGQKLKNLAMQKDQIMTHQAQLSSCVQFARESLKSGIQQHEVLAMKTDILRQEQQLSSPFQTSTINTETEVRFSILDAPAVCRSYGRVYEFDSPDPLKCVATGQGTIEAFVGERAIAILKLFTPKGKQCIETSALSLSFEVEFVSEITGGKLFGIVEQSMQQREYVISYVPTVKGRHQLHIKVDGQHIRGSPFYVTVTLPVDGICNPIQIFRRLANPRGVAVTGRGEVVVAEWDAHRVLVLTPCGVKTLSIGTPGSGAGQLLHPSDVTVDEQGNLLVLEQGNDRIQKFTANGDFVTAVGTRGCGPLQFKNPAGITYSSSNDMVYVVDTNNHRIHVLHPNLKLITMFGKRGNGRGQFLHPRGIITDSRGRVYVADTCNHRIQVFTAEGKFLMMFGRKGTDRGQLCVPWGIGVDKDGLLYVSENWNNRVSVFTSEGGFVTAVSGEGIGQFDHPCGLAVDDSGVVYLCDSQWKRVQLF